MTYKPNDRRRNETMSDHDARIMAKRIAEIERKVNDISTALHEPVMGNRSRMDLILDVGRHWKVLVLYGVLISVCLAGIVVPIVIRRSELFSFVVGLVTGGDL